MYFDGVQKDPLQLSEQPAAVGTDASVPSQGEILWDLCDVDGLTLCQGQWQKYQSPPFTVDGLSCR